MKHVMLFSFALSLALAANVTVPSAEAAAPKHRGRGSIVSYLFGAPQPDSAALQQAAADSSDSSALADPYATMIDPEQYWEYEGFGEWDQVSNDDRYDMAKDRDALDDRDAKIEMQDRSE
jgi:hypothetical protein